MLTYFLFEGKLDQQTYGTPLVLLPSVVADIFMKTLEAHYLAQGRNALSLNILIVNVFLWMCWLLVFHICV